jgi:IclR family acetate operon transcriptional repressor
VKAFVDDPVNGMRSITSRPAAGEPRRVQVLERVFDILDALAEDGGEFALAEVVAKVRLNKSTVYRLLACLRCGGYVERDPQTTKYRLGPRLIQLGTAALANRDLCQIARPFLQQLVVETGETAHLGVLRDGRVVSVANVEGPRTLRIPSTVGRVTPAHCSSQGKAILAFSPEEDLWTLIEQNTLRAYTKKTIITRAALKENLRRVRECGFALDDEEYEEGLRCVGAPVRDHTGAVIAAISIAGAAVRLDAHGIPALARSVMGAAADLSAALGYCGAAPPRENRARVSHISAARNLVTSQRLR